MSKLSFNTIPPWLSKPSSLQNVINNQLASLKDVHSFINMPDSSAFLSGLRQALFWRRRLSPSTSATTVIFSFLGPKGLILPNVSEVCKALRNVCNILNITEIYRAYNSHFIGISFNNPSDASKIRSTFSYYLDSIVIHAPISSPLLHHFKLLWLPPVFPDARIHHFLNKHSSQHSFTRDFISTDSDTHYPTNSVTGTLELLPNVDVNRLPHLIPLPPPHQGNAFFIISGRSSFCLRCGQLGHIRRSCSTPRCSSCHRHHLSSDSCSSFNSLLDSNLSDQWPIDVPDLNIAPVSSMDNATISFSNSASTLDSTPIFQAPSNTIQITDTFHDDSPTSQETTSTIPLHLPVPPKDATVVTKCNIRSITTAKRTLNSFSHITTPPTETAACDHSNLFTSLPDEANNMIVDSSLDDYPSHSYSMLDAISSNHSSIPPDHNITVSSSSASTHKDITSDIFNSYSACKRVKTSFSSLTDTSTPLLVPASCLSSPSWADQTEHDLPLQDKSSLATTNDTVSTPLLPVSDLSTTTSASTHQTFTLSSSSSESDDSSSGLQDHSHSHHSSAPSETYTSSKSAASSSTLPNVYDPNIDYSLHLYISGFPNNTSRSIVITFFGSLIPAALWHIKDHQQTFIGQFGVTFSSAEEVTLALAMNGQLYQNHTIFIQHFATKT